MSRMWKTISVLVALGGAIAVTRRWRRGPATITVVDPVASTNR